MDSIFSLFDIDSAWEVPFSNHSTYNHRYTNPRYLGLVYLGYNAFFMDFPVSSLVFHWSLPTMKSVDLVVARDGFLCIMESLIFSIFHKGYFDNRNALWKFLNLDCCVQRIEPSWRWSVIDTSNSLFRW